jgi:hypothetical protein
VLTASTGLHPPDRPDLERPPGAPPATRCGTPGSIGPRRFTLPIAMGFLTVRGAGVRGRIVYLDP